MKHYTRRMNIILEGILEQNPKKVNLSPVLRQSGPAIFIFFKDMLIWINHKCQKNRGYKNSSLHYYTRFYVTSLNYKYEIV